MMMTTIALRVYAGLKWEKVPSLMSSSTYPLPDLIIATRLYDNDDDDDNDDDKKTVR